MSRYTENSNLSLKFTLVLAVCTLLCSCSFIGSKTKVETKKKPPARVSKNIIRNIPNKIELCKTKVSNAPKASNRVVRREKPFACINGKSLRIAPAPHACLSSGFGRRGILFDKHEGLDYQKKPNGPVVAAASGTVISVQYRKKDYGNWIIIDHGNNLYSSYAHLASVDKSIKTGVKVSRDQKLGVMGKSGRATNAVHLHFEVRKGNIKNRKAWWGMKSLNPFKYPVSCN